MHVLASFPIACFFTALLTDIAYARTADMMWADFSAWLLAIGMFFGILAGVMGIVSVIANRRIRSPRQAWPVALGSLVVLILGFFDNLVHSRDAWTSVVPAGVALSAITVIVMLVTAWFSSGATDRRGVDLQYSGVRR